MKAQQFSYDFNKRYLNRLADDCVTIEFITKPHLYNIMEGKGTVFIYEGNPIAFIHQYGVVYLAEDHSCKYLKYFLKETEKETEGKIKRRLHEIVVF